MRAMAARIRRKHPKWMELLRFGLVGTTAMGIHYAVYFLLLGRTRVNVAFALGYFISFLYNYVLTSFFTFGVRPTWKRFLRFGMSHVANYCIQAAVLNIALCCGVPKVWAPVPVYAVSIPASFLMVRLAMLWRTGK